MILRCVLGILRGIKWQYVAEVVLLRNTCLFPFQNSNHVDARAGLSYFEMVVDLV